MADERVKVEVELVENGQSTVLRLTSADPRAADPEVQREMQKVGRDIARRMRLVPNLSEPR